MSDDRRPPRLREQVYRGIGWSLLQTWGSRLITFGVFLVLARLLGPSDFGIVTTAYVIVAALQGIVDLGVGDALVRRKDSVDGHFHSAFWVILGMSFVLYAALATAARPLGALFAQPTLPTLLWAVGATLPLTALSRVQEARLRKALDFRPLAMRALGASAAGGAVGIGMAVAGFGYWSLLSKGLVEAIVSALLLWRASTYRPRWHFEREQWRQLFRVGRPLLVGRLIEIVNLRLDSIIVSSRLGPAALGFYTAGQRVHQTLMEALFASINRVTLPAFARLQDDAERLRESFLRVVALASFFTFPLFALAGALAEPLVLLLFGRAWAASAPVLAAFSVGGVLFSVSHFNAPLMVARGRTDYVLVLMIVNAALNVAAFLIGVQWGVVGVALGFSLRGYIVLPLNLVLLKRTIGLPIGRYLANLLPSLLVTLAVVAAVVVLRSRPELRADDLVQLVALAGGAVLAYCALMLLVFPARTALVCRELELLLPRLPKMSRWIERYRRFITRKPDDLA